MINELEKKCEHEVVKEIGRQDTGVYGKKALRLGNCLDCYSTITIGDKYNKFSRSLYRLKVKCEEGKDL